jgi:hypothetical protein
LEPRKIAKDLSLPTGYFAARRHPPKARAAINQQARQ